MGLLPEIYKATEFPFSGATSIFAERSNEAISGELSTLSIAHCTLPKNSFSSKDEEAAPKSGVNLLKKQYGIMMCFVKALRLL